MRERRPTPAARYRARAPEERSLSAADPRFVGSFPRADAPLAPLHPEVALIGRSNVGKSSLLNALAGRRIARTAATPGKTRALTVYEMAGQYYFLDLPGYGYARAAQGERTRFRQLIAHVLERARLAGVLWLLDLRREPSPDDRAMHERFAVRETRVLAAFTKSDKVARAERPRRESALRDALGLAADQLIVTSARTGEGVAELREAIAELVKQAGAKSGGPTR